MTTTTTYNNITITITITITLTGTFAAMGAVRFLIWFTMCCLKSVSQVLSLDLVPGLSWCTDLTWLTGLVLRLMLLSLDHDGLIMGERLSNLVGVCVRTQVLDMLNT